jgi:acetoin utilization deacetylase AcuC-like enzyme
LNAAIAPWANFNPSGSHQAYLSDLGDKLADLAGRAAAGEVDYICVAHGADSHEWDQLGYQCSTDEWLQAAEMVYQTLAAIRRDRAQISVTLALFGGYRDDHPASVLGLHAMDTALALGHLAGAGDLSGYRAEVRSPR